MSKQQEINVIPEPLFRKIDCYSLPVEDLDVALAFYAKLGHHLIWREGDHAAGLSMPDSDTEIVLHTDKRPPDTYFLVDSVPRAIERIVNAGGTLVYGPNEIAVGQFARLNDPWDNPLFILDLSKGTYITDSDGNVVGNNEPE